MHDLRCFFNGGAAIIRDISDKKRLESQFLRAQRMESIGTLAGGIAHDLNNVLSPILTAVELLQMQLNDESSQRLLHILHTNAVRGSEMIKQALSFARGVEGEHIPLQPTHLIKEIIKILADTMPKNIEITFSIDSDLWGVSGDATQLHQVLMNLCVNARDAMPHGGKLRIEAENIEVDEHYARMYVEAKTGKYVSIAVVDTGLGIPEKNLTKIFDPFFTTKEYGQGTGLGLSTVARIVRSHDGFVNVYSELGRGARFKVYLPAIESANAAPAKPSRRDLPGAAQTRSEGEDHCDQWIEGRGQDCGCRANGREILSSKAIHCREAVKDCGCSVDRGMICRSSLGSAARDGLRAEEYPIPVIPSLQLARAASKPAS